MTIPAGYQLHITTWENDGDSYKTQVFSGLLDADVKFYLNIAKRFRSKSAGWHLPKKDPWNYHGNGGVDITTSKKIIQEALSENPTISPDILRTWQGVLDDDSEEGGIFDEILGNPENEVYRYDYENFCRVFSKFQVFYFPAEVDDVTASFQED